MGVIERDVPACGCAEPGLVSASVCYCAVEDLLRIIRRRYSLAVMNAIHARGEARYNDVATAVSKISSSTLAETLHALEVARLLDRRPPTDQRGYSTYVLTQSGAKLLSRFRILLGEIGSE